MKKTEPYRIIMHKFIGRSGSGGYTYEITFNRSLVHTGKFSGIAEGLNRYEKRERIENISESLSDLWWKIKNFFINLFK